MPKTNTSASGRPKNPVTLLDYLSFGVGAACGFVVSHHTAHLDGGYSITAGGFAAMGAQRAAVAALSGRIVRRRLDKRAEALAETLQSADDVPVKDLCDRLEMLRADWTGHQSLVITDQQFDEELTRISETFFERRYPKLPRPRRNRP